MDYDVKARRLVAKTFCPGVKVNLYSNPTIEGAWALADLKHGVVYLEFHLAALKWSQQRLFNLLIHEFTHVVEYLNDPEYLDPTHIDGCSQLAQTMEKQLGPLLWNLKWVRPRKGK